MLQTAEGPADCGVRLMIEDPLMEAGKYLKLLQRHSPDYLETHLLSFEVNMKKQKILLALQALKYMVQLDAENPDTHRCLIRFFHKVASRPVPTTDVEKLTSCVLEAERPTFSQLHSKSLTEANTIFLLQHFANVAGRWELKFCLVATNRDATGNKWPVVRFRVLREVKERRRKWAEKLTPCQTSSRDWLLIWIGK
ncbi:hypothetical protein L2E82_30064 [Cichorium intybus]|uniref:Uncharacterized protein n=1 Tax=Cichorium intybus TaxID=13427 RepID=A0ACB9CZS0_CICIN|nr:hypothetical protein L2E82_30064 [Cichorium intybus]